MVLQIKVIPHAQRSEVVGPMADGTLKVKVAAVPYFKVPRSSVEVVAGQTNTRKMVRLPDTA